MAEKKQTQKLTKILEDLNSDDVKKVSKGIKALEAHGNASMIKPLADLLLKGVSEKNEGEIIELLSCLKDTTVVVEVMDVLEEEKYLPIRQIILSTIWNTKVDFSNYIDTFVEIAVKGNFMESLDCLTIIENLEGPFMEEDILESQLHLKTYMESTETKDEQKAHILSEIALKLKEINMSLMD
ncbi:MAG: hypothetical protein MK066_04315 [Crocinitomicaceae bacterium]|nr:hypothetical protein [Crocinitomicaceae bacterium]